VGVVGLLVLGGSCVIYLINPASTLLVQVGVTVGAVLLLVVVLMRPNVAHVAITGRSVRYASNAGVMCLAFIAILVLINFLSFKHNYEFDLTETGEFTLSQQTIEVLKSLSEPVQVIGFFRAGDYQWAKTKEYLERKGSRG
jgi:NADH:ubiquinone oxidoreductase subunit 6 (subunit J)